MASQTVKCANRDVLEAMQAFGELAGTVWGEPNVALRIGRSFRSVRKANDDIELDREKLLEENAAKDADGSYIRIDGTGQVKLSDQKSFSEGWRAVLAEEVEIEVWPVDISALHDGKAKKGRCKECNRLLGPALSPFHLEVLVNLGALTDGSENAEPAAAQKDADE